MADFQTITTQDEFNSRIKARIAREREKWEKESGISALEAERDEARAEAERVKREAGSKMVRREAAQLLRAKGVTDEARISRILRLADLEGVQVGEDYTPDAAAVERSLGTLKGEIPEVFGEGSGWFKGEGHGRAPGADTGSSLPSTGVTITREQIERMSPDEIIENREAVDAALASTGNPTG